MHAFDHTGREDGMKRVGDKNAPTNGPLDCGYQERRRDEKGRTRKGGKKAVSG